MTKWQRWLRVALLLFVILFAAGVYLAMRRTPAAQQARPLAAIDQKATLQLGRGHYDVLKGKVLDATIDYDSVLEYATEATRLNGVRARFPKRDDRAEMLVTGDKGSVARDQSVFTVTGNVQVTTSDGLYLKTGEATYTQSEGMVRAPGKVEFNSGGRVWSGVGMTYDQKNDVLSLLDQVHMISQEDEGQPPVDVQSSTLVWARAGRNMRFERNVKIARKGQKLEADTALMDLTDDEKRVKMIQMQGNSRIASDPAPPGAPGAGGSLRAMKARDITLLYTDDGQNLQQATLAGGGDVEILPNGAPGTTRIAGEYVDFKLEADGSTLQSLGARGADAQRPAELTLPAQGDAPPRVIHAPAIQGPAPGIRVQPGRGLASLRCSGNVEYRETPAPPAAPRVATARLLDLIMQPNLGALEEARFAGNAVLSEGTTMQATAGNATYDAGRGTFTMTGNSDAGRQPVVRDAQQATIEALKIIVTPKERKVQASGAVQTTLQPSQKNGTGATAHVPAILSQDQPTFARSDNLYYDGEASLATFTSQAQSRLWQTQAGSKGGTAISAQAIRLDNTKGVLRARGTVVSVMVFEETDDATKQKTRTSTTVSAGELAYDDASRRATYTGSVALKEGEQQRTMKADRAVLALSKDAGQLDTLDGYGSVELQDKGTATTGARVATGDRLHYTASDGRYEVTGKLVKINEQCFGETQGRSLIFYRSVDRMIVDGNTERRTQTKGGQGCAKEPRFD